MNSSCPSWALLELYIPQLLGHPISDCFGAVKIYVFPLLSPISLSILSMSGKCTGMQEWFVGWNKIYVYLAELNESQRDKKIAKSFSA